MVSGLVLAMDSKVHKLAIIMFPLDDLKAWFDNAKLEKIISFN